MTEFKYSEARRCSACGERAIIPTVEIAERFVAKSEGRLQIVECHRGSGYHLAYPAVEHAHR